MALELIWNNAFQDSTENQEPSEAGGGGGLTAQQLSDLSANTAQRHDGAIQDTALANHIADPAHHDGAAQDTAIALNTAKVSADGSIDTHSDVDISTTAPAIGDTLVWDGSNYVPAPAATIDINSTSADASGSLLGAAPVSPPASPDVGDQHVEYYDNAEGRWSYNGSAWVLVGSIQRVGTLPEVNGLFADLGSFGELQIVVDGGSIALRIESSTGIKKVLS